MGDQANLVTGTWAPASNGFGLTHLPYGVFSTDDLAPRLGVRVGETVLDLRAMTDEGWLPGACAAHILNPLMALGPEGWAEVRATIQRILTSEKARTRAQPHLHPVHTVALHLPFEVADYVDFYSSLHHATNLGRMFRPDSEPLLPNWRHVPVGYHGRAGTVIVSGSPVTRPSGQRRGDDGPVFGPSTRLDIELEVGFVVGTPSTIGEPVPIDSAMEHVFGLVLVNDWSARDIQAWEYVPLGPFLGKSFATSIAPWVTPLAALEDVRRSQPSQNPPPLPYLRSEAPWALDLRLSVWLSTARMRDSGLPPQRVSATGFADMYWTAAQQLAHLTVNGASLRTGDLFASGTVSGPEPGSEGSLIELTGNGQRPIDLPNGERRSFLEDGDEVILRGSAGQLTLGEVRGVVRPG